MASHHERAVNRPADRPAINWPYIYVVYSVQINFPQIKLFGLSRSAGSDHNHH